MTINNHLWQMSAYRFGFNGKENDDEVKGQGNQQDYGMRIYDPRLGRFLSIDPLSQSYPFYTPYQFAGNKPIKYVDIDGLEEGQLKVTDTKSKIAVLTWIKNYTIVTNGAYAVLGASKIDQLIIGDQLNDAENHNVIYTDILPGAKDNAGNLLKVRSVPKSEWETGTGWKIQIVYSVTTTCPEDCYDAEEAFFRLATDEIKEGIIWDKSAPLGTNLINDIPASTLPNTHKQQKDIIYTNPQYFGNDANTRSSSKDTQGYLNKSQAITHEIGHDFGLNHPLDKGGPGLMNNINGKDIKPTEYQNFEIINNNLEKIKTVE